MDLVKEIEDAQRVSGIKLNAFAGVGAERVLKAMTEEARARWKQVGLPDNLLVISPVSIIQRYAEKCGINLID